MIRMLPLVPQLPLEGEVHPGVNLKGIEGAGKTKLKSALSKAEDIKSKCEKAVEELTKLVDDEETEEVIKSTANLMIAHFNAACGAMCAVAEKVGEADLEPKLKKESINEDAVKKKDYKYYSHVSAKATDSLDDRIAAKEERLKKLQAATKRGGTTAERYNNLKTIEGVKKSLADLKKQKSEKKS